MQKYLSHSNIRLRAIEPEDLDDLYRWENDSTLWEYGSTLAPYSRYVIHEYLQNSHLDIYQTRQLRLMVENIENGECMGTVDVYDFDPTHRRAAVGILIAKNYQQKGYGKITLKLLKQYTFDFLHLHQLYAYIPENNKTSQHLFEACGFEACGKLQEWKKEKSGYSDVHIVQCINR